MTLERKRKWVYWGTYSTAFSLVCAWLWMLLAGSHVTRHDWWQVAQFLVVPFAAAAGAAALACRLLRVSLAHQRIDVVRPSAALPAPVLPGGRVNLVLWKLDAEGLERRSMFIGMRERIPWSRIERCEIQTQLDALGRETGAWCVFFVRWREPIRVPLARPDDPARQRLVDALRGEPAPTELLSSEAPAGRGTELSAVDQPRLADGLREVQAAGQPAAHRPRERGTA